MAVHDGTKWKEMSSLPNPPRLILLIVDKRGGESRVRKLRTFSTEFRTSSSETSLSLPTPLLAYDEWTGHWLKTNNAAAKAEPPQLDTPAVIKWSVVTLLAIWGPFSMCSITRWRTFPMPISFPPSPIPIVAIFPEL